MTAVESLTLGTPMIVTKIPSFYEQGLDETNSIFVDFDLSNIDEVVKRMGKKFTFKYEPKPEIWGELLKGKRKEKLNPVEVTKVRATDKWLEGGGVICEDIQRIPRPGEQIVVEISTAEELIERGYAI